MPASRLITLLACLALYGLLGCAPTKQPDSAARIIERAQRVAVARLSVATQPPPDHRAARPRIAECARYELAGATAASATRPAEPGPIELAHPEPTTRRAEDDSVTAGPLPGFFATLKRDLKEMPTLLWSDTKAVYTNPWNLVFLIGAGGASAAVRPEVDDEFEDHLDRHHIYAGDWPDTFGALGNPGTHFAFASVWYLAGQQLQDVKTYEVGKRAFSALTITGVTTVLLKLAACTDAPNGESWAWPSGHTSSTMALATVLHNAYGPLVGVPMFGLTGLVAVERMDSGEHHFSDIVFGAALGWVVAETVMKEHQPELLGGRIVPYANPASGHAGIAWVKDLGR